MAADVPENCAYVLTAVLDLKNNSTNTVMVSCCDYGMEVGYPSQAIKLLVPDTERGVLRYQLGDGDSASVASFAIPDLELAHGQIRDLWATTKPDYNLNPAAAASSSSSSGGANQQLQSRAEIHVLFQYFNEQDVAQHTASVTSKLESVFRKRSQELIRGAAKAKAAAGTAGASSSPGDDGGMVSQQEIESRGELRASTSQGGSSGSGLGAAPMGRQMTRPKPNRTSHSTKDLHSAIHGTSSGGLSASSQLIVPGGSTTSGGAAGGNTAIMSTSQLRGGVGAGAGGTAAPPLSSGYSGGGGGGPHDPQAAHTTTSQHPHHGLVMHPSSSSTGPHPHLNGNEDVAARQVEELTWHRTEPYRKIIEQLESKVQHYEKIDAEFAGSRDQLEKSRKRNTELTEMWDSSVTKTAKQISELRKDYDGILAENQNLLKQLQEATATIYDGRDQQEQLVKTLGVQKANILLLEGKLKTHEQLGAQMRNYQEQDQDHINARHELQKEYRKAVDQFADSLHKLKKDVSKLQEEKTQLQLKLDETAMHLDSANFKVESLQLTNNSVCNSVSNSEWEKKRTQNEAADMTALRSDLLAANKRRDQLEAELSSIEDQSRVLLQQERKNLRRAQEDLEQCQTERTNLYSQLTKQQEQAAQNLAVKNKLELQVVKLKNEVADLQTSNWNFEALHKLNSELNLEMETLSASFEQLRKVYGRETECAQADVIPKLKEECAKLRKEVKRLSDESHTLRAQQSILENEKREYSSQLLALETARTADDASEEDRVLLNTQLKEKEMICQKQQVLLNQLASRLKESNETSEREKSSLKSEAAKATALSKRLQDALVDRNYDLKGNYIPDKMDQVDASLAAILNSKHAIALQGGALQGGAAPSMMKQKLPLIRMGGGLYLLFGVLWSAGFDAGSGRLVFSSAGGNGSVRKLSADEFLADVGI